jgi:GNAT superfamily N-acetyltransferase
LGLVSFVILERLNQTFREFWVPELVVSEEYRSQGVGKLLIQKCESMAKRKKCYRIRLESRNDRIDSHTFYKKLGFQQIALTFEKRM